MVGLRAVAVVFLVAVTAPARAEQVQANGPERFPGPNELTGHLGFASGVSAYTPSGFTFAATYGHRMSESGNTSFWFEVGVNAVLGLGDSGCIRDLNGFCSYTRNNGYTFEPEAGVKLKITTPIPLVPYFRAAGSFIAVVGRACGDDAIVLAARAGGGANYYLFRNFAVGLEITTAFGPAFFQGYDASCSDVVRGHTEAFVELNFSAGAELIF